jgi:hypothetical protein
MLSAALSCLVRPFNIIKFIKLRSFEKGRLGSPERTG